MKNRRSIIVFLTAATLLFACQSKKEKLSTQIEEFEKQVAASYDVETINQLIGCYQDYAKAYPKDSLSAEYLMRSADFNMRLKKGDEALADLHAVIALYPDNQYVPLCYFLKGFIYEDVLYDIKSAEKAYYDFVARYPSHELAMQASMAIEYLGQSPEDIIVAFNDSTFNTIK